MSEKTPERKETPAETPAEEDSKKLERSVQNFNKNDPASENRLRANLERTKKYIPR